MAHIWQFFGFADEFVGSQGFISIRPAVAQKAPAFGEKFVVFQIQIDQPTLCDIEGYDTR